MQQVLGPEQLREQQRGGRQKQKSYLQAQDRQFVEKDEWVWRKKGEETGDLGKDKMGQEGHGTLTRGLEPLYWPNQVDPIQWSLQGSFEFSLGYENNKSCQTYKILRCSWDFLGVEPQVVDCGIYDFESHSWKDLNDVFPKTAA
ncbi:hypothetical protein Bca52824_066252 [Brassica carinata]|uniref:F-box associated beta-propeller type 1 domain-containing protein n=1 Tax=Brassica carinata TaxID=52824 RepID=A0A8X7UAE2_BRACI|nr:hypothetical protein Bca52824_066252 [Brassica carinata]